MAMIGYMSLDEQVDKEFLRARRRALFARLVACVRGHSDRGSLLALEETRRTMRADNRVYLGRRVVDVSKIVGSVGRHLEFGADFMPVKARMAERWKRVDRAFHRGVELPPVRLYRLGDVYFVEDGNHRGSVARYQRGGRVEARRGEPD